MGIAAELRAEIERSGASRYRLSRETGVSEAALGRFVRGQGGLSLKSVELVCETLGLGLAALAAKNAPQKNVPYAAVT